MNEHDRSLALHWPAREMQKRDLYFHLRSTRSYPTHSSVRSAMHGHRRWELDPVFMVIRLLAALGLAWDIVTPAAYRRLESR